MWPFSRRCDATELLGRRGEKLAAAMLKRVGVKVLATNYRCPAGEVDIIALDRSGGGAGTVVFVEVKTRTSDRYTDPQAAVDADKQRRIRSVAKYYLGSRDTRGFAVRFDVVAIVAQHAGPPRVTHIPDAF